MVSACSGSQRDAPKVLAPVVSATSIPAPTATPEPVPVAVPSEAAAATPQGAAAFVKFYYAQLNKSFNDGRDDRVRGLSQPSCGTCRILSDVIRDGRKSDRRILGVSFGVTSVEAAEEERGVVLVSVLGVIPGRRLMDHGSIKSLPAAGRFEHTVALRRASGSWLVSSIKYEVSPQ